RAVLDRSQDGRHVVQLDNWTTCHDYYDPLAEVSQRDERWLAAQQPVEVRGQPTGLVVIVQERYKDLIGGPLGTLKTGVVQISSAILGIILVLFALLWHLVIRPLK